MANWPRYWYHQVFYAISSVCATRFIILQILASRNIFQISNTQELNSLYFQRSLDLGIAQDGAALSRWQPQAQLYSTAFNTSAATDIILDSEFPTSTSYILDTTQSSLPPLHPSSNETTTVCTSCLLNLMLVSQIFSVTLGYYQIHCLKSSSHWETTSIPWPR